MKKFIRWIAEAIGVAKQIRVEAYKKAGVHMQQYADWYTGGSMVDGHKYDISNILYEYPERCLKQGRPHLFGGQFSQLREELWKLSDEGKSIIVEQHRNLIMKQNMTPKEKAKHLALKFTSSTDVIKPNLGSIKMALLCVDVILNEVGAKDWEVDTATETNYWQDVETELSLL